MVIKKQRPGTADDNGLSFSLLREIKVLKELNHPNIIGLKDVFHLKGLLFFVQEYGGVDF